MGEPQVRRPVLVGYDGAPGSEQALCWAAEEAQLRDLPLLICHVWQCPYSFQPLEEEMLERLEGVGATVLENGVRRAQEMAEGLDIRSCLVRGPAVATLLGVARDAELVVLGSLGHGGFEELRVGSAAVRVTAHSPRPVIIVRPTLPPARRDGVRVVVGVDGSPAGREALAFGFAEAELRGGSVTAVCAWWDPSAFPGPDRVPFADFEAMRKEASRRFEEAVAPWAAQYPKVLVTTEFVGERPQRAVLDRAVGAVLLVLGDRGIGAVPEMILGPVTQAALAAAPCPVAVTPAPGR